ncbi:hypothetical protein HHL11_25910 [Ramlibacter sp. G-1-2-2]|uniref:Flagellar protein FliT n=1 Tax=Ramlibacter agri TaxID=2728837 RepID=A0A848HCK1_9BURK|nr:hypothetical protein [Ramlibacter agri]NML47209.1 hypothetical protein [Ramlibacter agri]
MFPSHSPQQAAIAAQLTAEIGAYERELEGLIERRWDPELYRSVSDRFDRMQMYAESLPGLSTSWTELLISRVELMHALWTASSPSRMGGKVRACYAQHRELLAEVRRKGRIFVPA